MAAAEARRRRTRWAVVAALAATALGITGYAVGDGTAVDDRPDSIGFGVPWSHELHARSSAFQCGSCHHTSDKRTIAMPACDAAGCHGRGPAEPEGARPNPEAPPMRRAAHQSCVGCHNAVKQGPTDCRGCHERNRGTAACLACHADLGPRYGEGGHALVPCDACHTSLEGNLVGGAHPRPVPELDSDASCLDCHGAEPDLAGFPRHRFEREGVHADEAAIGGRGCADCHRPHDPELP